MSYYPPRLNPSGTSTVSMVIRFGKCLTRSCHMHDEELIAELKDPMNTANRWTGEGGLFATAAKRLTELLGDKATILDEVEKSANALTTYAINTQHGEDVRFLAVQAARLNDLIEK